MNQSGALKHRVTPAVGLAQLRAAIIPRLLRFALSGHEVGRVGVVLLLLVLLLVLPLGLVMTLASFQGPVWLTWLAWLAFGLWCIWLGSKLEYLLQPERLAYQQALAACTQIVRQVSDHDVLLDRLTLLLFQNLGLASISVWRYRAEERILELVRFEGGDAGKGFNRLPLDLEVRYLHGTWPVSLLPESALRQGLIAGGAQVVASLSVGDELVGLMAFGDSRWGNRYSAEALRWLGLIAGQLALAVKSAYLLSDLAEALNKLQLAYRRTIDAEDEERRRLAVELHDDILSRLTTMTLALRHGQKQLSANPEQVRTCLETVEHETQTINRRLREITQGLHPSVLVDLGLISALQAYMDSLVKKSLPASAPGLITLTAQGFNGDRLAEPNLERDLYFITRQALDNAIEHAHADQVFIHLRWREDAVSVTVQDNGCGMKEPPEQLMGQNGRLGLLSMNERVLTWQGRLTFHTAPGNGTTVHIRIPIDQPSRHPTHLQAFTQLLHPQSIEVFP